jgi:hypothetical protein
MDPGSPLHSRNTGGDAGDECGHTRQQPRWPALDGTRRRNAPSHRMRETRALQVAYALAGAPHQKTRRAPMRHRSRIVTLLSLALDRSGPSRATHARVAPERRLERRGGASPVTTILPFEVTPDARSAREAGTPSTDRECVDVLRALHRLRTSRTLAAEYRRGGRGIAGQPTLRAVDHVAGEAPTPAIRQETRLIAVSKRRQHTRSRALRLAHFGTPFARDRAHGGSDSWLPNRSRSNQMSSDILLRRSIGPPHCHRRISKNTRSGTQELVTKFRGSVVTDSPCSKWL